MDFLAAGIFPVRRQISIGPGIRQNIAQTLAIGRALHGLDDIALVQRQPSGYLAIRLGYAVTDDAGNAFSRGRIAIQVGQRNGLLNVATDGRVTTQTEIAVGTIGKLVDLIVQRKIDGA